MPPFKTLSTLGGLLMLASCATPHPPARPTAIPATDAACKAFAPILFSRLHDTVETIAAVKAHNDAYDALCRPPV